LSAHPARFTFTLHLKSILQSGLNAIVSFAADAATSFEPGQKTGLQCLSRSQEKSNRTETVTATRTISAAETAEP